MSIHFHRAIKNLKKSLLVAVIAFTTSISVGTVLSGQEDPVYETLPIAAEYQLPDESKVPTGDREAEARLKLERSATMSKRRDVQRQVKDSLSGRGGNASLVEGWLNGFAIPEMTQTDNETLQRLGELRQLYLRNYLEDNTNSGMRNQVIDLTTAEMKKIAVGNFHPACRINAVYLLGRLNVREGNRTAGIVPLPVPELLPWLLQMTTSETEPEYLRVAAIAGLERHSSLLGVGSPTPLDPGRSREINDAMVTLITQGASENLSREANYWLKRRAINIVGNLGIPGDNGRYAKVLRDVIANNSEKLLVRTDAAIAYSRLDFPDASAANMEEMITLVAQLVITAADSDALYIDDKLNNIEFIAQFLDGKKAGDSTENKSQGPSRGDMGGNEDTPGGGGMGGAAGGKKDVPEILPAYHREIVRRRFKYYMWTCRNTLIGTDRSIKGGFYKVASDDDKKFIDALIAEFDKLMTATDIREPDPDAEVDAKDDKGLDGDEAKPKLSLADQLKQVLSDGASNITNVVSKYRPEEDKGLPGDDSAPPEDVSGG